jgi:hypothetical protein
MNAYSVKPRNIRCSGCDSEIVRDVSIEGAPHPLPSTMGKDGYPIGTTGMASGLSLVRGR